jgi:hypothetical protein
MLEVKPDLKIEATALKFYKKKDSEGYVLSKIPTVKIDTGTTTCRESIAYRIFRTLKDDRINLTPSGRELTPYMISFLPYYKENDTEYSCDYKIFVEGGDMDLYNVMNEYNNKKNYINLLNLYLGLTDTVLYNSFSRLEQKKRDGTTHNKYNISDKSYITYSVCSCEFLNNPFTVSLFLGIARDCLSLVYMNRTEILDKVDMEEVNTIIDTGDVDKARDILINIALPFLDINGISGVEVITEDWNDDDELEDTYYEEGSDKGTDTVNILTNPEIKKTYLSFLTKGLVELKSRDTYDNWKLFGEDNTLGIYGYGDYYEV